MLFTTKAFWRDRDHRIRRRKIKQSAGAIKLRRKAGLATIDTSALRCPALDTGLDVAGTATSDLTLPISAFYVFLSFLYVCVCFSRGCAQKMDSLRDEYRMELNVDTR